MAVKEVIIDGTERPIQRPVEQERQKLNYSGKKNRHTRKHLAGVDKGKRVLVLSPAREGKLHDKRFHDQEDMAGGIPEEIPILLDLGFQGVQKQYVNIHLPHKKPKGGELTPEQKQENKQLSKERVLCENALAGVKRYNAIAHIYRNRLPDFDDKLMAREGEAHRAPSCIREDETSEQSSDARYVRAVRRRPLGFLAISNRHVDAYSLRVVEFLSCSCLKNVGHRC